MRNLKISLCRQLSIAELDCCELVESGKILVNFDWKSGQRFLLAFQRDTLYLLTLDDGIVSKCSVNHLFPDSVPQVKGILCSDIFDVVYSFHKTGEVLRYTCNASKLDTEFFSHVNNEIESIEFSPDKEIVAYVSSEFKLKLITITADSFETICEYDMGDMSEGEQILVNVGWGKKETQFHGSEGKNAALAKIEPTVEECFENRSVLISWRGDSTMFAVGYWCNHSRKRRIKLFSRDGIFMCINEDVIGLDGPMSWKPQGNLIACSQQLANKYVISLFEKNGLKHIDFEIPPTFKVKQIIWNSGSTILGLLVQCSKSNRNYLMLWTCSNYHWYLKQMLALKFEVCRVLWDEDREKTLYIVSRSGVFYEIELIWAVDHCAANDSSKYCVSVIDNDKILVTPFHAAVIPPPMCKWTLKCPSSVNRIIYPPNYRSDGNGYVMCAILSDGKICLLKETSSGEPLISGVNESLCKKVNFDLSLCNWCWVGDSNLICISPFTENKSTLLNIEIDPQADFNITDEQVMKDAIMSTVEVDGKLIMYMRNGKSIEYSYIEKSLSNVKDGLPELCYDLVAFSGDVYGLSGWTRLYRNSEIICDSVTSFLIQHPFLLATTSKHTLIIINCLGSLIEEISVRKLERGSRLVAVTGNRVVMQMPRGNLETIEPRALTVLSAGKLIDSNLYKEAVQILRKQRISFDLCIDHNPEQFFANIKHFVNSVDPQWITLLITELSDSDVTRNIYSPYYNQEERKHIISLDQKINKVCSALLTVLSESNENDRYTLAILSCLVKMKRISEAIEMAWNNDQALQHLLFLVDVEVLYYEALGAYNLQAALKFAGKSQMDPKEYIAYLNSLKAMEENYMKYEIDRMLKRYDSALEHLSKCSDDKLDLMYSLIEEFHLYGLALKLCENNTERYNRVAFMYGQYLYKKSHFEESGIMFVRCGDLRKAIESFTKAGNWRQSILLAKRCNYSKEELEALGDAVCNVLISSQKYSEAAAMYKDCFSNKDKSIEMLLCGHYWNDALYLASSADNFPITERKIREKVLEAATNLIDEINLCRNNICRYSSRLKQVRFNKTKKPNFREFDEMSETSSVSSRSGSNQTSSNSSKGSRMTRKMSRKLWSLKEGNPREEEALMAVLSQTISATEKIISEVQNISLVLLHLKLDGKAEILQNTMKEFVKVIKDEKYTIWPKGTSDEELAALDAKYRFPPEMRFDSNWQLQLFTPSY
ncbi:hypothetical protein O3M35_008069 [Rhynocoris fuscipes]|uniref:Elongator complex protein 1 n=1 Tax=Rhynocoris fuscipes TaxID=488301 RepID=A0AAW1D5S4_9HEMI